MERLYLVLDSRDRPLCQAVLESSPTADMLQVRLLLEDGEELLLAWLDQLERVSPNEEDQNTLRYLREECGDRDWPQVEARTRALLEGPYHGA